MTSTNGHGLKRAVLWAILYARVSTDEQARSGYFLAQQIEAAHDHRPPQPESQQPFRPLPSSPPLPSFRSSLMWSGTTQTSMTDPGCQRITHLQYLLRGDPLFPGIVL
jgi:hypothetical protein